VPDPLAGLWSPEWRAYDAVARALPDCEHNRAWRQLGPGRGVTSACPHNREHHAAVAAAWSAYQAALRAAERARDAADPGVPGVGVRCAQEALW
jgi:hypothetical protein